MASMVRPWTLRGYGPYGVEQRETGDDEPSIRLAETVGARLEREMEFRSATARIYRHPHPSELKGGMS